MNKKYILIGFIVLAMIAGVLITDRVITMNAVKQQQEQEDYSDWLVENCECVEWERIKCSGDYTYNPERKFCVYENKVTFPLKACSKYDCNGEIHIYNFEEEEWQKNLN